MATPNLTKIHEIHNEIFQQPYSNNTCNFTLRLFNALYYFYFLHGFISGLVAEILEFASEIQRKFANLYISP